MSIDMEHPLQKTMLTYGYRGVITKTDNPFTYHDIVDEETILNTELSNVFTYNENTQALYFSADRHFSKQWIIKLGLRYEATQTKGHSKTLNKTTINNYSKLFPTLYLSYNPNDNNSFSINYGRRI